MENPVTALALKKNSATQENVFKIEQNHLFYCTSFVKKVTMSPSYVIANKLPLQHGETLSMQIHLILVVEGILLCVNRQLA
jgi:hypothetical protein